MESTADIVHAAQWAALRAWVDTVPADSRALPSSLDGWTVDDLISHLARTLDTVAALRPVDTGRPAVTDGTDDGVITVVPGSNDNGGGASAARTAAGETLTGGDDDGADDGAGSAADDGAGAAADDGSGLLTIGDLLGGYAGRAPETAEKTKRAAAASAADRAGELDAAYAQAQRTLTALGDRDPIVTVPGGGMRLSDFLETSIIELVVHARDLQRSLPDHPGPPVLAQAGERAERVLRQVFRDRAGVIGDDTDTARLPGETFLDIASGRVPAPAELPAAVRAELPLF